jgi:PleD family two-component response regulator
MPNITVSEAQERFEQIGVALSAAGTNHSVTFGLAEAEPTDSLRDLIGRADDALLEARSSESNDGVAYLRRSDARFTRCS